MQEMSIAEIERLVGQALECRLGMIGGEHTQALRLFNGYAEGLPGLVVDLYAATLLISSTSALELSFPGLAPALKQFYLARLPWLGCVLHKSRSAGQAGARIGRILHGEHPDGHILEHGVGYAVDLLLNQDASFYLETRSLRSWLIEQAAGWRILNVFAYTGSLGVAGLAGGAARVLQVDRSRKFLALARQSAMLSSLDLGKMQLRSQDFFQAAAELKKQGSLFDCVILDPPFFSSTPYGKVNLAGECSRLINKVRPLVAEQGWLVSINNALFYSGADYLAELERLCRDGYLAIEKLIEVPADAAGFPGGAPPAYPADPAPFNHPTKIALLRVIARKKPALP